MESVIYKIENKVDGKFYIGSSVNFKYRKWLHLKRLRDNTHHSKYLQRAYNKYGEDSFLFSILEDVSEKSKLIEREQHYIDTLNPEYNICRIANSSLGVKRSKETKEKCRLARLGEKHTPERRLKKSISQGGKNHVNYGKKLSAETNHKKSVSMKKWFETNQHPTKNKKLTKERIEHLRTFNNKPVLQYDKNDNFIREYKSIIEASTINNVFSSNIISVCKGKVKTCGGFKWKYKN